MRSDGFLDEPLTSSPPRKGKMGNNEKPRAGDWKCPNCNDLQFARNAACRRCGAPKPTMESMGEAAVKFYPRGYGGSGAAFMRRALHRECDSPEVLESLGLQRASPFEAAQGVMSGARLRSVGGGHEDLEATGKWGKRYVTWAEFREGEKAHFWHFNTHWCVHSDEQHTCNEEVRFAGARKMVETIRKVAGDGPVLVTGDFNAQMEERGPQHLLNSGLKLAVNEWVDSIFYSDHWELLAKGAKEASAFHVVSSADGEGIAVPELGSLALSKQGLLQLRDARGALLTQTEPLGRCRALKGQRPQMLLAEGSAVSLANRATYVPYFYSRDGYAVLGHSNVTHFNMMAVRYQSFPEQGRIAWAFEGAFQLHFMLAPSLAEGTKAYYALTGRPPVPPRHAFGFMACRWGWPNQRYLEETVQSGAEDQQLFVAGIRKPRLGNRQLLHLAKERKWIAPEGGPETYAKGRWLRFSDPTMQRWYAQQMQLLADMLFTASA
eukprot:g11530.t1